MHMTTPPPTRRTRPPANDAEAALVQLHKILFPSAHDPGAEPEPWNADTIEDLKTLIVQSTHQLGLIAHTPD